eukprot:s12_g13.t2
MIQCLILECTPQAQFDAGVRKELEEIAQVMGWKIHETTLALSHQWPCRRHRWWVILCPAHWDTMAFQKWPIAEGFQTIRSILPGWGLWSLKDETALQLTTAELCLYSNPEYGNDQRLLGMNDMASTFLHSYGSILTKCPCGCREFPFSESNLRSKGLRGSFVVSRLHGQPRHLHPTELFALHGVPLTVSHLSDLRSALCLIGQLASPLQAMWVFSQLCSMAMGCTSLQAKTQAIEQLNTMKRQMIRDLHHMFRQTDDIPRQLSLLLPDGELVCILASGSVTVAQLLRAETFTLAHGEMMHLCDGPRELPADQILLEQGAYGPYGIRITQGVDLEDPFAQFAIVFEYQDDTHVAILRPGSFLFQAMHQCDLDGIDHFEDEHGKFYGLDYRVWGSLSLQAFATPALPRMMAFGLLPSAQPGLQLGLTDMTVWKALVSLCGHTFGPYDEPPLMITPSMATALLMGTATQFQCDGLRALYHESNGQIFCIFQAKEHWALLCGLVEASCLTWTYFDGLREHVMEEASSLAWTLCSVLRIPCDSIEPFSLQPQTYPHTCGTVAIMHLCLALGLDGHFAPDDELRLHQVLVGHQAAKTSCRPLGRSVDPSEKLANFLQEKGVPTESAMTRATDAIKILGASSINEAFQTSNPWATLKGLASKPSTRFRWVHEHELKQHIAQQAKKKHGAFVPHAKQKKQSSTAKSIPQVDPTTLRLLPDIFVDADGDEIPQIAFSEVGQDATGLAFCTYQEARPFIEAAESISSTTLGLLINTEIPRDLLR